MEQALGWGAGLTLAGLFVGALVWLSSRYDSGDSEQELEATLGAARKVVRCCDGRHADCPAPPVHHRPGRIRVPSRW
jgi:hypothetical protein